MGYGLGVLWGRVDCRNMGKVNSTREKKVQSLVQCAAEFWVAREVRSKTARMLDALKPRPFRLDGSERHPITKHRSGIRRWRFELGRPGRSKRTGLTTMARWAVANKAAIRAARRAGLHCEAHVEIVVHHWRYEFPIEGEAARRILDAGLDLRVVFCRGDSPPL